MLHSRRPKHSLLLMKLTPTAVFAFTLIWTLLYQTPAAEFSFAEGVLTIRTERYEAGWRDGSMVALKTLLPVAADLTARGAAMSVEQMPNGLGSFHGHAKEGRAQHHPWGAITGPFSAQHPPNQLTQVEAKEIPGGMRLTYRGLARDPTANLVQELTVEKASGDLLIRQEGTSEHPGVFGISFSLLNLRPDIELLMPYFGGQRWRSDYLPGQIMSLAWSQFWNAGFVIGEVPGGGTFIVRGDDPQMRPKYLRRWVTDKALALGFEACNDAPFDETRACQAFTWRFNTYAGGWQEPAAAYKRWMVEAFKVVPRSQRSPQWASEISLIWPRSLGVSGLDRMAAEIDPKKVLLMDFGMLKDFNRRIPEYLPADPDYAKKVAAVRERGFHAGCYTSLALIDQETHPTMMRDYGLEYFVGALTDEKPAPKDWLVYVHPGSARWREFYARTMRWVHEQLGIDFLYQDVSGCAIGSSGVIDGRTFPAAVIAGEDDIRRAVPAAALAGEFWSEVNACRENFGLATFSAWGGDDHKRFISRPDQPHPILSYIFGDFCLHWPHLVVLRDTERFHRDQNINEVTGAIPVWEAEADDRTGEVRLVLERARLFAQGFRPWFPEKWEPGTASYLRDPAGRIVRYVRQGESTHCLLRDGAGNERLVYARVNGVDRFTAAAGTPVTIDGWPGYGESGPIGLDPAKWYSAFPAGGERSPALPSLRITSLPPGAVIEGARLAEGSHSLVQVRAKQPGEAGFASDQKPLSVSVNGAQQEGAPGRIPVSGAATLLFAFAPAQPVTVGEPLALEKWRHLLIANGLVLRPGALGEPAARDISFARQARRAFRVAPPLGGVGSEFSIDGFVALPREQRLTLRFATGIFSGPGDGMNFVVRVNGREMWRLFRKSEEGAWRDATIPLGEFAGQEVVLSLAVDCGPSGFNTSCDDAAWGDVKLVVAE